jgi:hypothetical protein
MVLHWRVRDPPGAEGPLGRQVPPPSHLRHIEAGADEVIFSFPFADTAGITAVAEALGLGGQ